MSNLEFKPEPYLSFYKKSSERKSPKKYFFYIFIWPGLMFDLEFKPKPYLSFYNKSFESKSPKKYFFIFSFDLVWCLTWSLNRSLTLVFTRNLLRVSRPRNIFYIFVWPGLISNLEFKPEPSLSFYKKSSERKAPKKYFFIFSFWCLTWSLNRSLTLVFTRNLLRVSRPRIYFY